MTLEILGRKIQIILQEILDTCFCLPLKETDINLDWTIYSSSWNKSKLGKYGYSRDHRPDKLQIKVEVSELRKPINIPIRITVNRGNFIDLQHFPETYNQVKRNLKKDPLLSLIEERIQLTTLS